jgi:hypothetical protein
VALRALGLEDLLARLGVAGGSLRERRHRRRAHAERSETADKRRRRTATSGLPSELAPKSQGGGCSIDQAWRRRAGEGAAGMRKYGTAPEMRAN